jgi:hypothetical protein
MHKANAIGRQSLSPPTRVGKVAFGGDESSGWRGSKADRLSGVIWQCLQMRQLVGNPGIGGIPTGIVREYLLPGGSEVSGLMRRTSQ